MVDLREFRRTLGRFATGVTVVTMREKERAHGITVNAFMSVSLRPPLIAVCIDKRANAHATLLESDAFGVSVLRDTQEDISNHFAGRPVKGLGAVLGEFGGVPVVEGALALLACRLHSVADAGDHSIFLGEVEALEARDGVPLLYFQGQYAHIREMQLNE